MAEKISLQKNQNISDEQFQNLNAKIDFLIDEIQAVKIEMKNLRAGNAETISKLDSRIYSVCSDLKSQVYNLESKVYSNSSELRTSIQNLDTRIYKNSTELQKELETLEKSTLYSRFLHNATIFSPAIIVVIAWAIVIYAFFG